MSRVIFSLAWFGCPSWRFGEWPIAVWNLSPPSAPLLLLLVTKCLTEGCWASSRTHRGLWRYFLPSKAVDTYTRLPLHLCPLHSAYVQFLSSSDNGTFCDPHRLDWPSSSCKTPEQSACHIVHGCLHVPPAFPPTDMISVRIRPCLCHYGPGARLTTWHVILIKRLLNEWKNGLIWSS